MRRLTSAISAIVLLLSIAAFADEAKSTAAKRYGSWGVDLQGMDRSVKPGDDFFKYVNGKWAAATQIPPDKTGYGAFAMRCLAGALIDPVHDGVRRTEAGIHNGCGKGQAAGGAIARR